MKSIATLLLCVLALFSNCTVAQPVKIGFIDAPRIERESKELQLAADNLKREFAAREREIKALESKVSALRADLDKPMPGTPVTDLENRQHEFTLNVQRLDQARRALTEDVQMRKNEELKIFYVHVNAVVEKIAKARNLDLVLQDVTFISKDHDISDEVIKSLNDTTIAK